MSDDMMTKFILDIAESLDECGYPIGPVARIACDEGTYFEAELGHYPRVALNFYYPDEYSEVKDAPNCGVTFRGDDKNFAYCGATSNMNKIMMNVGMAIQAAESFAAKNVKDVLDWL